MHKTDQTSWATSWCVVLTYDFSLRVPCGMESMPPRASFSFWFSGPALVSTGLPANLHPPVLLFSCISSCPWWPLASRWCYSDSRRVPFGLCFVISLLLPPKVSLVFSIGLTVHFLNCFYLSHSFVLKCWVFNSVTVIFQDWQYAKLLLAAVIVVVLVLIRFLVKGTFVLPLDWLIFLHRYISTLLMPPDIPTRHQGRARGLTGLWRIFWGHRGTWTFKLKTSPIPKTIFYPCYLLFVLNLLSIDVFYPFYVFVYLFMYFAYLNVLTFCIYISNWINDFWG